MSSRLSSCTKRNCASLRESASSQIMPTSVPDNKMSKRSERLRNKAAEEDPVAKDGKITAAEKAPRTSGSKKKDGNGNSAKSPLTDNSALESRFGRVMPADYLYDIRCSRAPSTLSLSL